MAGSDRGHLGPCRSRLRGPGGCPRRSVAFGAGALNGLEVGKALEQFAVARKQVDRLVKVAGLLEPGALVEIEGVAVLPK